MEVSLAVSMSLILAAILSAELRISSAVVEIFSGIVLVALLPEIAQANWLHHLAHLGMLALMFVAGFELQVGNLRRIWRASGAIGISSFLIPFSGIYFYTKYALGFHDERAILVAIALSTTSLALVYHVLKEHKILNIHEGQIIFGAATIVDVLSMVALAVVLGNLGWGTAIFLIALVMSAIGLPRFGNWVFRRYPGSMSEPELRFLMVVLVGMGFMAESVGSIHPALAAFAIGMIMAGVLEKNEGVKDKMLSLVFSFFAPLFFLEAGTRIQFENISPAYLFIGLVLFALATSLKYFGTYIPARLVGMSHLRFLSTLFNYRLSFGIVTANVGLETGVLSQQLYGVIMLAIVVSAAVPGILLRRRDS